MAPRARVAQPVRGRLPATRRSGLTSPARSPAAHRQTTRRTASQHPQQEPRTSRRNVSGRRTTPPPAKDQNLPGRPAENDHLKSRGGSRLRGVLTSPGPVRGGEVEYPVVVAGRVADEHVRQHLLGDAGCGGVADEIDAELTVP